MFKYTYSTHVYLQARQEHHPVSSSSRQVWSRGGRCGTPKKANGSQEVSQAEGTANVYV